MLRKYKYAFYLLESNPSQERSALICLFPLVLGQ